MTNKIIFILIIIFSLSICAKIQSQKNDSIIIGKHKAIKLVDSVMLKEYCKLTNLTIERLKKANLNPNEYYLIDSICSIYFDRELKKDAICVDIYTLKALQEMIIDDIHVGGHGGANGQFDVIIDKEMTKVLRFDIVE